MRCLGRERTETVDEDLVHANGDYWRPQERGSNAMEKQKRQESTK